MRVTDNRYRHERRQFELALRMIQYEARTGTIKQCTGLSDDRIRKLYRTYVAPGVRSELRRRRGKPPHQTAYFFRNPVRQLEATTLAHLFALYDLHHPPRLSVEQGARFCDVYELFVLLHRQPQISFERAWSLLDNLGGQQLLTLGRCRRCGASYLRDALAVSRRICPCCRLKGHSRCRAPA